MMNAGIIIYYLLIVGIAEWSCGNIRSDREWLPSRVNIPPSVRIASATLVENAL
jgi:hypothetical protein